MTLITSYSSILLLLLLLHFQFSSSLRVAKVSLNTDKEYLRLQDQEGEDYLECHVELEGVEKVDQVVWYHNEKQTMTWGIHGKPIVGKGVKEKDLILTRNDWNLQFANLTLDLTGNFSCHITTSQLNKFKSDDYELLVIDMPEIRSELSDYFIKNCRIDFTWRAPATFPRPEPLCGIWSLSHSYISSVATFEAIPYYNGSVGYNLMNEIFEIYNMPPDSLIRCELRLTKSDETVIQLLERKYESKEVLERGCAPLRVENGIAVEYKDYRTTCHDEVISEDSTKTAHAVVSCEDGYEPSFPDLVTEVTLECKGREWSVAEGQYWNHYDSLVCSLSRNEDIEKVKEQKEDKEEQIMQVREEEKSSAVHRIMSPWIIIVFVSLTILSGIVWGFKGAMRKKDPRYMA